MHTIIKHLEKDHSYMLKLIHQLNIQTKALSGLGHAKADIDTVLEIINYLKDFPEHFHHPVEEKMFGLLSSKTLDFKDYGLITKAIDEHILLDALTELLDIKISGFLTKNNVNKVEFLKTVDKFSRQQLNHISYEQDHIFPLCEKHLTDSDWGKIEESLSFNDELNKELEDYLAKRDLISNSNILTANHTTL